jgi:hypothetical protein
MRALTSTKRLYYFRPRVVAEQLTTTCSRWCWPIVEDTEANANIYPPTNPVLSYLYSTSHAQVKVGTPDFKEDVAVVIKIGV